MAELPRWGDDILNFAFCYLHFDLSTAMLSQRFDGWFAWQTLRGTPCPAVVLGGAGGGAL